MSWIFPLISFFPRSDVHHLNQIKASYKIQRSFKYRVSQIQKIEGVLANIIAHGTIVERGLVRKLEPLSHSRIYSRDIAASSGHPVWRMRRFHFSTFCHFEYYCYTTLPEISHTGKTSRTISKFHRMKFVLLWMLRFSENLNFSCLLTWT